MERNYCHLKLDERRKLAKQLEAKMPVSEIADRLGRAPSTIYRDIKRNKYTDDELSELSGYHALVAQDKTAPDHKWTASHRLTRSASFDPSRPP